MYDCLTPFPDLLLKSAEFELNGQGGAAMYNRALSFYEASIEARKALGIEASNERLEREDAIFKKIMYGAFQESLAEIKTIISERKHTSYPFAQSALTDMKTVGLWYGFIKPEEITAMSRQLDELQAESMA